MIQKMLCILQKVLFSHTCLYIAFFINNYAYATAYNLSSGIYPPCDTSWSVSGANYTCSGNGKITLLSGDTIVASSNAILTAANGITIPGNNTIGTTTHTITLVSTYGNISVTNSTLYGSIQSSSGAITLTGSTLSSNITSSGTTNIINSNVGGNISSKNGITTNNSTIIGTLTATNGNIVITGGTINGKISATSNSITSTGANLLGGAIANSGITISNGTISGDFSLTSNNSITLDTIIMTSGSLTSAQDIKISNSNLGSANSPITIKANGTIDVKNSSIVYGNLTAAIYWSGSTTITKDSTSIIIGTCAPNNGFPCTSPSTVEYRIDECSLDGTSGEVKDSSGRSYHATAKSANNSNIPQVSKQVINNGVILQRTKQQYIAIPTLQKDTPNFSDGFTVTTWAKFSSTAGSWERIFDFGNGADQNNIFLGRYDTTNNLVLGIHESTLIGSQYLIAYNAISDSNWHFWAVSCSGNTCNLYKDGVNIATSILMKTPSNIARTSNYIGKSNWSDAYLEGGIDEFKIFDDTLSSTQISTIYTNESAKKNYDGTARTTGQCNLPTCFTDNFNRTSGLGSKWNIISTGTYPPDITNNKLMITKNYTNISSGVSVIGKFPSSNNLVEIEFEHNAYGGNGADGISVVLSDANVTPVVGTFGGSLGYAQKNLNSTTLGFAGGWLGFGLDEYGNFANDNEGRGTGCTTHPSTDLILDSVTIRGRQGTNRSQGYCFIANSGNLETLTKKGIDNTSSTSSAPSYKYKFIIDTRASSTHITVQRDVNDGNGYQTLPNMNYVDATQTAAAPEYFRLSFTGSTGDSKNYHSIDDLSVKALYCGTLGQESVLVNLFDAWDTSFSISNRKIQTKIVNSPFSVNIASLDQANSAYQEFNGTTCVRVVDSSDSNLTSWNKLSSFTSSNNPQTISLNSNVASKDSRISIKWKQNQDVSCDAMVEDNSSKSSDNFAIRPNSFSSTLTTNQSLIADKNSSITFQANKYNGTGATNYNESINNSFKIDVNITDSTKTCAVSSIAFSPSVTFANGISSATQYSLPNIGNYKVSMYETVGSEFALVDASDTSWDDRKITPYTQTIVVLPSKFSMTGKLSNGGNGFSYLSDFSTYSTPSDRAISATLDLNISALSENNVTLSNYTALCYAKDANLTLNANTIGNTLTNLSKLLWYETNHDLNGSLSLSNSSSYILTLSKALFNSSTNGMASLKYFLNFDRNNSKPVDAFNFKITDINTSNADKVTGQLSNFNQNAIFYYGRAFAPDYSFASSNSNKTGIATLYYEVYCKDCNRSNLNITGTESVQAINWYQNTLHSSNYGTINPVPAQSTKYSSYTFNNSTNPAKQTLTLLGTTNIPFTDKINLNADSWLVYYPTSYAVSFTSASGKWAGEGKVNDASDTNSTIGTKVDSTQGTSRTHKRLNW